MSLVATKKFPYPNSTPGGVGIPGTGVLKAIFDGLATATDLIGPLSANNRIFPRILSVIATLITGGSTMGYTTIQEVDKRAKTAAVYTTALSGSNNDLDYAAVTPGAAGNNITIAYVNPGTPSATLGVVVTGSAIVVNLATDAGTAASAHFLATTAAVVWTAKAVGTAGDAITVAYVDPGADNASLSVVVSGATVVVNLATDSGGAITSTASSIVAALPSNALVTAAVLSGGGGTVTAFAATALSAGTGYVAGVNPAITTIASDITTALGTPTGNWVAAAALVSAVNHSGNDGTGVVTALSAANLSGGLEWTLVQTLVNNVQFTHAATNDRQDFAVTSTTPLDGNNYLLITRTAGSSSADQKELLFEVLVY